MSDQSNNKQQDNTNYISKSDVILFNSLLTSAQIELRKQVYNICIKYVKPIINTYYEQAKFPIQIIDQLKQLNICGLDIPSTYTKHTVHYNTIYKSAITHGIVALELARYSSGISTFFSILQPISMLSIYKCGSTEQKVKYLPDMAKLNKIGCFCLTEPNAGSDAANIQLQCTPHYNETTKQHGWLLNGEKRWIGSSTIADILIVWARNTSNNNIHGFIVERIQYNKQQLDVIKMENKIGLREIENGHIKINDLFITDEYRLSQTDSFATGPNRALVLTRIMASWIAVGTVIGAYDNAVEYLSQRKQFNSTLTSYQIIQQRLMTCLSSIQSMLLFVHRVSQLYDNNQHTIGLIGLCKQHITQQSRYCLSLLRDCMGGNGLITDYGVARAFADIEGVHSFEGTADINMLIAARQYLGKAAFYAATKSNTSNDKKQQSKL